MTNGDLGYNYTFEESRARLGLNNFSVARVISEHKEAYRVKNFQGEYFAKITGKQIFAASTRDDYPAVGDWVAISQSDEEHAVIQAVLPRQTIIKRKHGDKNKLGEKSDTQIIAANIDVAFVIESTDRDFNLNRFERYFTLAKNGGVQPAIILNKIDLLSKEELNEKMSQLKDRFPSIDVIFTSAATDHGLDDLKNYITKGKTYCFLGSSGVGKSSLINKLLGEDFIKTDSISSYSGRGKHTTTARQMYFLENGGIVIDNPGIREVGLADAHQGLDGFFGEIANKAEGCRYADCTHTHEPGCKVIEAVKSKELDEDQYKNYLNLKKEADYYEMNENDKREKDRKFGKLLKNFKKDRRNLDV